MADPIAATQNWVETVVVGLNFCPFAKKEVVQNTIRYTNASGTSVSAVLEDLASECQQLEQNPSIETTLLILPCGFEDYFHYLDLLDRAERQLQKQKKTGIFQLASFHPDYCFAGCEEDDPANYTNRSPYPMLHILREESLEQVLQRYKEPESIPENNIQCARGLGVDALQRLLESCFKAD